MKNHLIALLITLSLFSFIGFMVWALEFHEMIVVQILGYFSIFGIMTVIYLLIYTQIQASQKK